MRHLSIMRRPSSVVDRAYWDRAAEMHRLPAPVQVGSRETGMGPLGPAVAREARSENRIGARLLLEKEGRLMRVRAVFVNNHELEETLRYDLTVQRFRAWKEAQTRARGTFSISPREATTMATVPMSTEARDILLLSLVVYRGQEVIDSDWVRRRVQG